MRSITFVEVTDWFTSYVVKKHADKEALRQKWMAASDPMTGRAGWSLTSEQVAKSPGELDPLELLEHIEPELGDAAPEVQWAMNFTLVGIGIHFPDHRARALAIGEKFGLYRDYPVSKGCISPFASLAINEMVSRQG